MRVTPHKPIRVERQWDTITVDGRECGNCYACCVWLGIEELKKWMGQSCRHLDGSLGPNTRCSIYEHRPSACSTYQCFWRKGFGPPELRPYDSGILITPYQSELPQASLVTGMAKIAFTVLIFDRDKGLPFARSVATELLSLGAGEVRLVDVARREATLFAYGSIYNCKVMRPSQNDWEALSFDTDGIPLGHYALQLQDEAGNIIKEEYDGDAFVTEEAPQ